MFDVRIKPLKSAIIFDKRLSLLIVITKNVFVAVRTFRFSCN